MEDDLNILANERQPQYFAKWKMTSIFWQMEDDLNILANGRQSQHFGKKKMTSLFLETEDNLNILKLEDKLNILASPSFY